MSTKSAYDPVMASKGDDILAAWADFFIAHALSIRAIEARLRGIAPLSLDEYDLLLTLSREPRQQMRLKALAEATIYTKSGISRIAQRMQESGYLRREECAEDRRGALAVLTDRGRRALQDTWQHYSSAVLEVFGARLTHHEVRQLGALLQKIVDDLRPDAIVRIGSHRAETKPVRRSE